MTFFAALVRNELYKSWRSRWMVFVIFFGLLLLVALGVYAFYVHQQNRWSPPPPTPWQTVVQGDLAQSRRQLQQLEDFKQRQASEGGGQGPFAETQRRGIDTAIKRAKQSIADDKYLLDNQVAPMDASPLTEAAAFGLGGVIMFLLIRIFGWLASEQVAGERSDRTLAMLLSRPAERDQVLLAKAVAGFLMAAAAVLAMLVVVYLAFCFLFGSFGSLAGQVGIPNDPTKPLGPGNLTVMPIPVVLLLTLGATLLAVLSVQGMAMLASVLFGRWAAVGITLAVLFGAPILAGIVSTIIVLISGSQDSARFVNYLWFNELTPVAYLAPAIGNSAGTTAGISEFTRQVLALAAWTIAFYGAAAVIFHRKEETA